MKKWTTLYDKLPDPLPSDCYFENRISRPPLQQLAEPVHFLYIVETYVGGRGGLVPFPRQARTLARD